MTEEILKLKEGEHYIVPEQDYGKAEIHRVRDMFVLFEIPQFGGNPIYNNIYNKNQIELLIKEIESWT